MNNGHGLSSRMRYGEKIDAGKRFLLLVSDSLRKHCSLPHLADARDAPDVSSHTELTAMRAWVGRRTLLEIEHAGPAAGLW